ncbi:MAG: SpoIIE family protein phosphatase [Acidobacteriota bacterium]|nr:SpoIIE family protein phosphatase [Acidobacteriota bacterium]
MHSSLLRRFSARRFVHFFRRMALADRVALAVVLLYVLLVIARQAIAPLGSLPFLGLAAFIAFVYLVIRLSPWVRHRLLWSLRNRLWLVYVFAAVIPIVLLVAMVAAAAWLLELQIGAHLLHDDLQERYSVIAADTNAIAAAVSREKGVEPDKPVSPDSRAVESSVLRRPEVAGIIAADRAKWPDLSAYLNHGSQLVRALNGKQFAGLVEFRGALYFSSAESIPVAGGKATVLVIAPITSATLDSLPPQLGPTQLTLLDPVDTSSERGIPLNGTIYLPRQQISSVNRKIPPPRYWLIDPAFNGFSTLQARRADLGADAVERPVLAKFALRPSSVNSALLTSVGDLGPYLVGGLEAMAVIFLLLEIAAFTTGYFVARTITASVSDLYDGTLHVRRGDLGYRVRITRRDQLGSLAESFNEMIGSIGELLEEQRERQRLAHEVEIAREVQQQLFPRTLPSVAGLDLAAICRPARVVSGDYYDFITLSPTRVALVVADISGKGIFAALLMASLQAALRSTAMFDGATGTSALVSRLNRHLFKNTSDDRYATLFYAVYDSAAKTLIYTNAGHLPPVLITDGCVQTLDQGGTVVGLFEDARYTECTLPVKPGSVLVAFSDGLTEPENVYGEEFGMARLKSEILHHRELPAGRIAENLVNAVEQWAGTPEQADDITVVVARMD